MPVSLTTVADGDPIDYDALRTYTRDIEHYINEGVVSGDLQSSAPWVRSSRVFKPDIKTGGAYNYAQMVSGEIHWARFGHGTFDRSVHHSEVNTRNDGGGNPGKYVPVEGMTRSFCVPEAISSSATTTVNTHRVAVAMDWYCYEVGGNGTVDDSTDHCSDFALFVDGTAQPETARPLYTGSTGIGNITYFKGVKQYSLRFPVPITTAGEHHIGLRIRMYSRSANQWRHVFVSGRSMKLRWYDR